MENLKFMGKLFYFMLWFEILIDIYMSFYMYDINIIECI